MVSFRPAAVVMASPSSKPLPTIVVVDHSKEPDEQKKTQITIYAPEDSDNDPDNATANNNNNGANGNSPKKLRRGANVKTQVKMDTASKAKISMVAAMTKGSNNNEEIAGKNEAEKGTKGAKGGFGISGKAAVGKAPAAAPPSAKGKRVAPPARRNSTDSIFSSKKERASPQASGGGDGKSVHHHGLVIELQRSDSAEKNLDIVPEEIAAKTETVVSVGGDSRFAPKPRKAAESSSAGAEEELASEMSSPRDAFRPDRRLAQMPTPEPPVKDASDGDAGSGNEAGEESDSGLQMRDVARKDRDPKADRAKTEAVVKALQQRVKNRRPAKIESKWLLWKYRDDGSSDVRAFDWTKGEKNGISSDVGWGRRIYDKNEIEVEDRDRERKMLDEDATRHLQLKMREIPAEYGLWDRVYDKRVIRSLDCNAKWTPNRKEMERRKKAPKDQTKEEMRKAAAAASAAGGDNDDDDPFAEARKKWVPTGTDLTEEDLVFCQLHTKFDERTVQKWFNDFRIECPEGKLTKNHLHSLFKRIFPGGDSEVFCNHIFRIFDNDGNGFLDFKEFLMALDVTSCRSQREKLQWAFRLYDVDASGSINLKEITAIMETLDEVEGRHDGFERNGYKPMSKRAEEIFGLLDVDHDGEITMDEFVEGYLKIHTNETGLHVVSSAASISSPVVVSAPPPISRPVPEAESSGRDSRGPTSKPRSRGSTLNKPAAEKLKKSRKKIQSSS